MTDTPTPPQSTAVSTGTSAIAIFTTVLMSGLFILKGNTINVECVGCLYDPNTATNKTPSAQVAPAPTTETIIRGKNTTGIEYDCNHIKNFVFGAPPVAPTITADMLANPQRLVPSLTKFASDQRQYRYEYQTAVAKMIDNHNTLCK